jgi:hypothetical protein
MKRNLPLIAIAVVVALGVIGVAIFAVAQGGSALAYEVNGSRVSQETFDGQLHDLASNDVTKKQASQTEGSVTSTISAQLMNLNIFRDLLREVASKRGVKLTAADRSAGVSAAKTQLGANYARAPKSYRDLLADLYAHVSALGLTNSTINAFLAKQARTADVYVNPKYGFWNPRFGVCPPTGCAASSSSGNSG